MKQVFKNKLLRPAVCVVAIILLFGVLRRMGPYRTSDVDVTINYKSLRLEKPMSLLAGYVRRFPKVEKYTIRWLIPAWDIPPVWKCLIFDRRARTVTVMQDVNGHM